MLRPMALLEVSARVERRGGGLSAPTVLQKRVAELVAQHGGLRPLARVLRCDVANVHRMMTGRHKRPRPALLRRLGLRERLTHEVLNP